MVGPRTRRIARFLGKVGIVVAAAVVCGAVGWLWGALRPPLYAATATVMVRSLAADGHEYEAARSDIARTPALAALSVSAERLTVVASQLHLGLAADDLALEINARTEAATPFFAITARAAEPRMAAAIANALADLAAESGAPGSNVLGTQLIIVEGADVPARPAYARVARDVATSALVGAMLALAVLIGLRPRRMHAHEPKPALQVRPVLLGAGVAVVVIGTMALGAPEPAPQGLTLLSAGIAVVSPTAGLAMLAIMLPLQDPVGFGPFAFDNLVIGGTAYGVLIEAARQRRMPRLGLPVVAVIAFLGLAVIGSAPMLTGLEGDRVIGSFDRLLQLGAGLLLVLAAAFHFARSDPRPILVLVVIGTTCAAVLALLQLLVGDLATLPAAFFPPVAAVNVSRPSGPFLNANYFGVFMAIGLITAIGLWRVAPRLRLLMIVCLVPIVLALVVGSLSRGALLAVGAGVLTLVWGFFRPRVALPVTAVLLVAAFVLLPLVVESRIERSGAGTVATAQAGVTESDQGRFDALAAAVPLFQVDPVFGIGFGQYGWESARYVGNSLATSAHNQYLNLLAEQGIVGMAALLALVLALAASLRRAPSDLRWLVTAAVVTYAVGSIFLEPLTHLQTSGIFWIAVAAGVGPRAMERADETAIERVQPPVASPVAVT